MLILLCYGSDGCGCGFGCGCGCGWGCGAGFGWDGDLGFELLFELLWLIEPSGFVTVVSDLLTSETVFPSTWDEECSLVVKETVPSSEVCDDHDEEDSQLEYGLLFVLYISIINKNAIINI